MIRLFKRPALLIGVLGTLLTLLGSWELYRVSLERVQSEFKEQVRTLAMDLELELQLSVESLYGLHGLFLGSTDVSPAEFEQVAKEILVRHPDILSLEWIARVSEAERAQFEKQMQALFPNYRIWQPDRQRDQVTLATERPWHFPIQYIHPARNLMGMDVGFDPDRQKILERASEIQGIYLSDPIMLIHSDQPRKGFFAILPVHRSESQISAEALQDIPPIARPAGYVRGVFSVERIVHRLQLRPQAGDIRLVLTDTATAMGYETLYDSHPDHSFAAGSALRVHITPSPDRQWSLLAAPLKHNALELAALWAPLQLGVIGLVISWLVATIIHLLQRRTEQVERLVERRTQELNSLNERLATMSLTDELTGIDNRRSFDMTFHQEWKRAARHQTALGIVMIDIDYFKRYNDSQGHQAGDRCLRAVAQRLREEIKRPGDRVARYGGEEFVILLPNADPGVGQLAELCRVAIESLAIPHPASPFGVVTLSLGLAVMRPQPGNDPVHLLKLADDCLYRAKNAGRNRVMEQHLDESSGTV